VLAYDGDQVAGWAAVAPRAELPFARSRTIPRVDDLAVWSAWCIRVRPGFRGRGVSHVLLDGAVAYAREHGAPAVEGYPVDNRGAKVDATMAYVGTRALFERPASSRRGHDGRLGRLPAGGHARDLQGLTRTVSSARAPPRRRRRPGGARAPRPSGGLQQPHGQAVGRRSSRAGVAALRDGAGSRLAPRGGDEVRHPSSARCQTRRCSSAVGGCTAARPTKATQSARRAAVLGAVGHQRVRRAAQQLVGVVWRRPSTRARRSR
jgi:GNAT superfamily N-acetyltransferase